MSEETNHPFSEWWAALRDERTALERSIDVWSRTVDAISQHLGKPYMNSAVVNDLIWELIDKEIAARKRISEIEHDLIGSRDGLMVSP